MWTVTYTGARSDGPVGAALAGLALQAVPADELDAGAAHQLAAVVAVVDQLTDQVGADDTPLQVCVSGHVNAGRIPLADDAVEVLAITITCLRAEQPADATTSGD